MFCNSLPQQEWNPCTRAENSFEPDLTNRATILSEISEIARVLKRRLDGQQTSGHILTLKVKYPDYQ